MEQLKSQNACKMPVLQITAKQPVQKDSYIESAKGSNFRHSFIQVTNQHFLPYILLCFLGRAQTVHVQDLYNSVR
jgi:hypothetical protein